MRAALIINPVSGDDVPNSERVSTIQTYLARGEFAAEVLFTEPDRSASQLAREAVAAGAEIVIVGGGDGTVGEVAAELIHQPATLGIIPIGTFNNIARSLGIPNDLAAACTIITKGHTRTMDVGMANGTQPFFEAAGAGLDATLFPLGEEIKGGRWMRIFQAARLTMEYRPQPFEIILDRPLREALPPKKRPGRSSRRLDSNVIRRNALLVVVANGPYYGGGFAVSPGARLGDGCFTVAIYRNFSKWELARHFWSITRGRYHYHPKIETYFAAEVTLKAPGTLPVHLDGKPYGETPITLRTAPGALKVFVSEKPVQRPDPDPPVALPVEAEGKPDSKEAYA